MSLLLKTYVKARSAPFVRDTVAAAGTQEERRWGKCDLAEIGEVLLISTGKILIYCYINFPD